MKSNQLARHRALALVAGLLLASPTLAGVVYEIEVKDHAQSPPKVESIEAAIEGRNIKMDVLPGARGGKRGEMIFRGDRREVVVVDHDNKAYYKIDEEMFRSIAGSVGAAMGVMQDALKNLPEDKRKEIEEMMKKNPGMGGAMGGMMGGEKPAPPEVRKTGERATHNGYPCVKYDVVHNGRKIRELWVTDWSNVEGGTETQKAFREMADFFEDMMEVGAEAVGGAGFLDGMNSYAENFGNGFPVVSRSFDESGSLEDESTLRGSRRQRLDPDAFEPPSGYKRMSMGPQ